ncbi:hypothetical protein N9S59_04135 [Pseudomonadota bacterium]|nr:hypothetical protein [Pseudomonadota bacterium]
MNNLLSSNFSTSIPFASVIFSTLHMIYGADAFYILAAACVILPAIAFLCVAGYVFFQYGRYTTVEIELDSVQLGLIQLATILLTINSLIFFFGHLAL